jgi:hypothetical protein
VVSWLGGGGGVVRRGCAAAGLCLRFLGLAIEGDPEVGWSNRIAGGRGVKERCLAVKAIGFWQIASPIPAVEVRMAECKRTSPLTAIPGARLA